MAPDGRPAAKLPAKYGGDDDVEWNEKFSAGEACAGPEGVDAEDDEPGRDGPHEDDESHAVEGCEAITGLPPCASPWSCHCALPWRLVEELIAAVKFLAEPAAGYSPGDGLIAFRLELAVYLPHNLVGLRL